jgi:membrane peptidoglycan carboxypeptidase
MLEVYFNIIEWGPNVYGIGEASRFYFQKSPSELTFNECLFGSDHPKPKKIHVSI